MYTVHMPRVTATAARRNLFHLLDAAEKGEEVILERRGARFRLSLDPPSRQEIPPSPLIVEDPDILSGDWTWRAETDGELTFTPRRR
jgi:hypothetical protein